MPRYRVYDSEEWERWLVEMYDEADCKFGGQFKQDAFTECERKMADISQESMFSEKQEAR